MVGAGGSGWGTAAHLHAHPQELCKQLHAKVDKAEEEKYDMEMKVQKSTKEVRGARGAGAPPRWALAARRPLSPPHPLSWRT